MSEAESILQLASMYIRSTMTSPIATTLSSAEMLESNPAPPVDSNREQYEREQQDLSFFNSVLGFTEHSFQVLARRLLESDDHILNEIEHARRDVHDVEDHDHDDVDDDELDGMEHVDDDQEKNCSGHARDSDDDDNDDDDDDDEDTDESELSINLGHERDPSHHTNDDNASINDNEAQDYEFEASANSAAEQTEQNQTQNSNSAAAGALNDEIDDDDDLDVETSVETYVDLTTFFQRACRMYPMNDDFYRTPLCGHIYKCNCPAEAEADADAQAQATAEHSAVSLSNMWQHRPEELAENEKHALDEIETESKQVEQQECNSEEYESSIDLDAPYDIERSFSTFDSTYGACPHDGIEYDPGNTDLADAFADKRSTDTDEWTTEEEEEVAPCLSELLNYSAADWPGVKLPFHVSEARYHAFLKRLASTSAIKCDYQQLMLNFEQTLVLPRIYMDTQVPVVCFCESCYGRDSARLQGWAYFKLNTSVANKRAETSVAQLESCNGEWLPLYYMTGVDNVRRILDLGHLLPIDVYRSKESSSSEGDMGSKEEPSRRVELHVSPNAKSLQSCAYKPKLLVFEDKKYRLYTAFEVYVRRQALRRVRQASAEMEESQRSEMPVSTLAADLQRLTQNVENFLWQLGEQQQQQQLHVESEEVLEEERAKIITNDAESDDEMDISAALSESVGSRGSASQTADTPESELVLNAAAIAMAAEQGPRLKERVWFTKEAGACVMTALLFKMELKSATELTGEHLKKLAPAGKVKEVKTSASARPLAKSERAAPRVFHYQKFSHRHRRRAGNNQIPKKNTKKHNRKIMAKPNIPEEK